MRAGTASAVVYTEEEAAMILGPVFEQFINQSPLAQRESAEYRWSRGSGGRLDGCAYFIVSVVVIGSLSRPPLSSAWLTMV